MACVVARVAVPPHCILARIAMNYTLAIIIQPEHSNNTNTTEIYLIGPKDKQTLTTVISIWNT